MALDGGEWLASWFHQFTLKEKGPWDLDSTETKPNACIGNKMSFSLQPVTLQTMI